MKNILQERLSFKTVIFDGAMGTELYKRNFFVNVSYENLCLSAPKVVQEIHTAYKNAGAEVLTTNSYGANFANLSKFGLGDKVKEINAASVNLARKVAGDALMVAGSVGPVDIENDTEAVAMLVEQTGVLLEAEADFIIFETLSNLNDVKRVLRAVAEVGEFPYVLSCVFNVDGDLKDGTAAENLFALLKEAEYLPTAFGMNCGLGPDEMLLAFEKVVKISPYPVIVQPNAGLPKNVGGRTIAMCSPEYFTT
ncbi:MAG: homocysteine S-methyltransferase family protein, partial [Lentisphaeria bacterium]|nr:homocysteine S-methyltransferase family protein [Lentisphaeria bacterium]